MSLSGGGTVRGQPLTLRVPQGVGAFLLGQVRRLEKPAPGVTQRAAVEGVVLAVDGRKAEDFKGFRALIGGHDPGDTVVLTVVRGDDLSELPLTFGSAR